MQLFGFGIKIFNFDVIGINRIQTLRYGFEAQRWCNELQI